MSSTPDLERLRPHLPAIEREAAAMLTPGGTQAAMVALERMFAVLKAPADKASLRVWLDETENYPARVIADTATAAIRNLKFRPTIAEFVAMAEQHEVMRTARELKAAAWKVRRCPPAPPPAEVDPGEVSAILARFVGRDPASQVIPKGDVSQSRRPLREIDREARARPLVPMGDPA